MSSKGTYISLTVGLFGLLLIACEKIDVPDPANSEPVFYTDLTIGDSDVDFIAGMGYEMKADFRRDGPFIEFIGVMKPSGCGLPDCRESLRFNIRHSRPYQAGSFSPDESLRAARLPFRSQFQRDSMMVKFDAINRPSDAAGRISWLLDGKRLDSQHNLLLALMTGKPYQISLQTRDRDCESTQTQTVVLPRGGCRSKIVQRNDRSLGVLSNGKRPLYYNWMDKSQDSIFPLPAATAANQGNIWVRVTDADGCVSESQIGFKNGLIHNTSCVAEFDYDARWLPERDTRQWGSAVVQYIDSDGKLFTSNQLKQPNTSSFEIISVEDFAANDKGEATKKLTISLSCLLYDSNAEEVIELRGTMVIAVAYPGS